MKLLKLNNIEFDEKFASEAGSVFVEQFHGEVLPTGKIVLVSDGFVNKQEELESWQESTEIESIVAQFTAGNIDILNQKEGFFGDITSMPKSYPEVVQMMYNAEENFMKLPVEVRGLFNNDLNQFIAQYGTDSFYKKINDLFSKDNDIKP